MRTSKTKLREKVLLIAGGICLSLLLLETGLRAGGAILSFLQEHRNQRGLEYNADYRIVCLGESTTANGGENAYPNLLEKELNRLNLGARFKVINKGMAGRTSSEIVMHLDEILDSYRPQMVVTMMGINDRDGVLPYHDGLNGPIGDVVKSLRVYKLICLLKEHIKVKISEKKSAGSQPGPPLGEGPIQAGDDMNDQKFITSALIETGKRLVYHNNISEALKMFEKAAGLDESLRSQAYAYRGWGYRMDNQLAKAEESLRQAVKLDPRNSFAYQELAHCADMRGQKTIYEEYLKKAVEVAPDDYKAYQKLAMYYMLGSPANAYRPYLKNALALKPDDDQFLGRLASYYMTRGYFLKAGEFFAKADRVRQLNYSPTTRKSYQKIKDSVLKRGIRLVCIQYPVRSVESLKRMLDYDTKIVYVDNESVFKKALKAEGYLKYFTDTFAGDFGHCTPEGNALLAGNIAREIARVLHPD